MTPEQIEQLIRELLKTGEILATKAFELAIRQIYTYAILDIVVGVVFLLLGVILTYLAIKNNDNPDWDNNGFPIVPTWMLAVLFDFLGVIIGLCSIRYFINPEWYAVKLLLETFIK